MDKDRIVETLKKNGFNAKNQDGVVIVLYPEGTTDFEGFVQQVRVAVKQTGYEGSWGCRYAKDTENIGL